MPDDRVQPERDAPRVIGRRALLAAGAAVSTLAACTATKHQPQSRTSTGSSAPAATTVPTVPSARSAPSTHPPTHAAAPTGPAVEIARGSGARPEVALTFHGAGDPGLGRQLLAALSAANTRATIMAVGTWLQTQPELARQFKADGHELGNHTWSHQTLDTLGAAAVKLEIERCRDHLIELTGGPGTYFRQSGSQHSTPLIRELAGAAGYRVCLSYDVDSLDWTDPGADAVVANSRAAGPGSIISLHLGHAGTVTAVPRIISELRARGLRPVTASELLTA